MSAGSSACHLEVERNSVRKLEVACCTWVPGLQMFVEVVRRAVHSLAEARWWQETAGSPAEVRWDEDTADDPAEGPLGGGYC